MAGDYYLWKDFANKTKPISVTISLGVQRKWEGQLQNNLEFYYKKKISKNVLLNFENIQIYLFFSILFKNINYQKMKFLIVEPEIKVIF